MLGGKHGLILFSFPIVERNSVSDLLGGIPFVGQNLSSIATAIPIPIYLDPRLTGMEVIRESRSIDVKNDANQFTGSADTPALAQRGLDNEVQVDLVCSRNNAMLDAMLAFCDIIFTRLVNNKYTLTYLNGSVTVFGGKLAGFTTSPGENDTKINVSLRISKANQTAGIGPLPNVTTAAKTVGTTPLGGLLGGPG